MQMGFPLEEIQRVMKTTNEKQKIVQILLGQKDINNKSNKEGQLMSLDSENKNDNNKMKDENE